MQLQYVYIATVVLQLLLWDMISSKDMDNKNLPSIKVLFVKLYNAHVWAEAHPQEKHPERWNGYLLPYLEDIYNELEKLGGWREFSMALFAFGIDYLQAMRSWEDEHKDTG